MRILVTLTLLFFELLLIPAHVVPASELQDAPSDVYEIQESGHPKTTFVAPKPKKPTLREILFYHVIEKPYGGNGHLERQLDPEPPQIETDETMRPFTNGHGYQFADFDLHETEHHDASSHSDTAEEAKEEEEQHKTPSEEVTEEVSTETTTMEDLKADETTEQPTVTTPSEEKKNRIKQRQFLFDRLKERYSANFKKPSTTEKAAEVTTVTEKAETTTTASPSAPSSTPTPASSSEPIPTPAARVKRAVNYEEIPLAPTLPPLDYRKYPGLRVYSGIQPMYQTTIYPIDTEPSNEEGLKEAMKNKINDIFATMKPYDEDNRNNDNDKNDYKRENNDNKNDIRVEKNNDGNDIRVATHKPENKPKTYGMNLSEDQGYVWNNMWRPINYHVGEPVKLYEVNEYEVSTVTPIEPERDTTTEPITTTSSTTTTITTPTPNPKDTEDIFIDVKKRKPKPTTSRPVIQPNKEKPETEPKSDKEEPSKGEKNGDNVASKSLLKHKKKPNQTEDKPSDETKPDLYEQLMTSDKFWKWLAHWTSNYMEVLSDRVKNMVKKEVAKEMKKYENAQQNVPLNQTKDKVKPNNVTTPIKDEKVANNSQITVNKDKTSVNKTEITPNKEPVAKNNTIIVDGKEIPITNTTNFDAKGNDTLKNEFLRKHRDENKRPNNNKLPTKDKLDDKKVNGFENKTLSIEIQPNVTKHEENYNNVKAENVFGSSTGNDKVTNIFIFYPGTEAEKIIDGLKPYLNNSITGIATAIKNNKKTDKDHKKEDTTTEKPIESTSTEKPTESTTLASKEPDNGTTQKPVKKDNKIVESKPEKDKTTKLEPNKEPNSNSTATKNPDRNKENLTEKIKETTEKVTPKVEASTTTMPNSTEKAVNTTTILSTTLKPLNSTSIAPTDANSTSLAPEANSTSSTTPKILTH